MTTTIDNATDVSTSIVFGVPADVMRDLATAVVAAGKDDTLPTLTGVRLEWGPFGVRTVATDRYRLAVVTWQGEPETCHKDTGGVLIPAADLAAFVKALPKANRYTLPPSVLIKVIPEANAVMLTAMSNDGEFTRTIRTLDGEFPKWESLIPTEFTDLPSDGIAMNPKYLADVAKMPAPRNAPVRVRFTGDRSRPMVWDTPTPLDSGVTWRYLLMPVRFGA